MATIRSWQLDFRDEDCASRQHRAAEEFIRFLKDPSIQSSEDMILLGRVNLRGDIYDDDRGRFEDGTLVATSNVAYFCRRDDPEEDDQMGETLYAVTLSGTRYKFFAEGCDYNSFLAITLGDADLLVRNSKGGLPA